MNKSILTKGEIVGEKYTVSFFIKRGSYAETYRVQNESKETKFLKLFDYSKLHRTQFTESGDVLEIEILNQIKHPNLVNYNHSGNIIINSQKFAYVILDFISGETLSDKMNRDRTVSNFEAKSIVLSVLNGLNYLHKKNIIHSDITTQNILLDLSGNTPIPKIIDFGCTRYLHQSHKDFLKDDLNLFYTANELFNKVFSTQSDVYSVGALYYHLLNGLPPYFIEISKYKSDRIQLEETILEERNKPLKFTDKIDELTQNIIRKALQPNVENRFKSIQEFIQALNGELEVELSISEQAKGKTQYKEKKKGKGFEAIAGMQELKDTIQLDVIDALNNQERYAEYGLTIPNGMLLYGPPGCGKTFFAEKLAEEIGFNFYQIKPSDIQSKWVNASQENIKNLFDEARENAPSIIFIDELDALVPNRDTSNISHMNTSAVNEFLAQMNNCGDEGVFVVGATNRPNSIDPAVLRSGRLDKHIYLPPPDFEARKLMFELYLRKRPTAIGLNYERLSRATENFVSSDIKFLSDEASRKALKMNSRISEGIILETIKSNKSSLSKSELESYTAIKATMEGNMSENIETPRIGFKK
ncbi:MAG: AAA family ATPase [Weeksellaceae bacterium]|nr:AAA family ATPase [Bacteroidota bacterium]MCG2780643.1 AAA family ATPase [Weeksellaceae bacterium]